MEREIELEREVQIQEQALKKEQQSDPFGGMFLKVYVNLDNNTYYITVFAASSLKFITYEVACQLYEAGKEYYQITDEILVKLKQIFKDRIVYQYFQRNKSDKERIKEPEYKDSTNIDNGDNTKKDLIDKYNNINYIDDYPDGYNNNVNDNINKDLFDNDINFIGDYPDEYKGNKKK